MVAKIILYYVVSPVHLHNTKLLAPELPGWDLRLVYEKVSPWLDAKTMSAADFPALAFSAEDLPEVLWQGDVGAVVFSTLQPRSGPLALLEAALDRRIPTIGIEESNQIALNQGTVNNYVLPVDHVLTASEHERRGMVAAGFPAQRFKVTGWPFYGGRIGRASKEERRASKEALGLDPDAPVAALTLTGLHDAGESPAVRERQLSLAAQGLPEAYQLVIKPHPIESLESLMPFVERCAPRAHVVEGKVRIERLLQASDILLNRGVSQVCIEALLQEIPVIVLETGIHTPLHGVADDFIVETPEQLRQALELITDNGDWLRLYDSYFAEHAPFTPAVARSATCNAIVEIAEGRESVSDRGLQWFDMALFWGWAGDRGRAIDAVRNEAVLAADCPGESFERLIAHRAEAADLDRLKMYFADGFRADFLRCLWIDQMRVRKLVPDADDLQWLKDFPPEIHPVWFIRWARVWVFLLEKTGHRALADEFVANIYDLHLHVPGVSALRRDFITYKTNWLGRIKISLKDHLICVLIPLRQKLGL